MKRILILLFLGFISQSQMALPIGVHPADSIAKDSVAKNKLGKYLKLEGRVRSFYMSTAYQADLKDDYALGIGAGMGLHLKPIRGFSAGISAFYIYNLVSSDIFKPDPSTLQPNRYEVGLFDILNPGNIYNMYRLEELYLNYQYSKSSVRMGRMNLNTPFFNSQDGRMSPTFEEGVWIQIKEWKHFNINGGFIWSASPRSTVNFYKLSQTPGMYPVGVNSDGSKAQYYQNIEACSGMGLLHLQYNASNNFKFNLWDSYFDNVMNSIVAEMRHEKTYGAHTLFSGLMWLHQDAINNGGNVNPSKTYMDKGSSSNLLSAQIGLKNKRLNGSVNYTHITGDGKYLMPREWGRDMFYTFLPRERNEGLGMVHAIMAKANVKLTQPFQTGFGLGYYHLPDVKNYRLNKYSLPSYVHFYYDFTYTFQKALKGLEFRTMIAYKMNAGNTYENLKYEYNRVNMINLNFILDYRL